ncbi:beta/gamma crystallin-related protein [Ideonella paludis]|uniref:Beta/gamma crystallin family protein n=1 Tax=Ideonella paludis TaxID=1233411 RepID=A0ABS5E1M1_9BURK|nr:beta/gamma crystallin-related protein [Ideonella paludis]MBQ0937306.1 beta/gamma crystallin family protein [Ideonella paludis]
MRTSLTAPWARTALLGMTALAAVAQAQAAGWNDDRNAPVVVYEHAGGAGRALNVTGNMPNLDAVGFNDEISSIEVRRGQWLFCEHADFRGKCITLGPGRHSIETYFNDAISSIRMADGGNSGWNNNGGWSTGNVMGAVTIYEHIDSGGRSLAVNGPMTDLSRNGFNDSVSSVDIRQGSWQFCSDADFGGRCITLGPGRHNIDALMNDEISSIRQVAGNGGYGQGGSYGGSAAVTLYQHIDFRGSSAQINGAAVDLSQQGFNDQASSIEVRSGRWEFCMDANFAGQCFVLGVGRHAVPSQFNDKISSVRPVGVAMDNRTPTPAGNRRNETFDIKF